MLKSWEMSEKDSCKKKRPSLEAQLTNLADEIAYNNHDIDDGIRSGLITDSQLCAVPLYERHRKIAEQMYPGVYGKRLVSETIRRIIHTLITDLIQTTTEQIRHFNPHHVDEVRELPLLVSFSDQISSEATELKQFLFKNLYRHYQVNRMMRKAKIVIEELFDAFMQDHSLLPVDYQLCDSGSDSITGQARRIADYVAGMTDRFAMREHRRIFSIHEPLI